LIGEMLAESEEVYSITSREDPGARGGQADRSLRVMS